MTTLQPTNDEGPRSYRNWRAYLAGTPTYGAWEAPIYSDANLVGAIEEGLGPYKLSHVFPATTGIDPAVILFVESHLDGGVLPPMSKTNTSGFTGAWLGDEIAALLSLALGIRLMAGGVTRDFGIGSQPHGISFGDRNRPVATFRPTVQSRSVLPRLQEPKQLVAFPLDTFPLLEPATATALVRAARSYRDAIWIAEAEPELAWLMLVSAIEVAAIERRIDEVADPVEALRMAKPELAVALTQFGEVAVETVAKALLRELKATVRFLEFMRRFMPPPPDRRPPVGFQLDWSPENLKKCMQTIYHHRSHALHEGTPFPPPMCEAPQITHRDWDAPIETVPGPAAYMNNGVWEHKETPISLHTFE